MWVNMTGELQVIKFNLNNIPDEVLAALNFVYMFPVANNATAVTGTLVIHSTVFNYQRLSYVTADPIVDFDVNNGWFDDSNELFTSMTYNEGNVAFTYARTSGALSWGNVRSQVQGNFSDFDYLVFEITGTAGKQVLVKVEGPGVGKDLFFDLTGEKDVIVLSLTSLTPEQANAIKMVLIFAEPLTAAASGSFTVHKAVFTNTLPEVVVKENAFNGKGNNVNTNLFWQTNSGALFTVTYDVEKAIVAANKTAGSQWSTIKLPVNGDFSVFSTIEITVLGPVGAQILFKINPSYEKWVTTTGVEQVITWDISGVTPEVLENLEYVYAFPGAHTDEAFVGTFEISSFKWIRPVNLYVSADPVVDFTVNQNWQDENLEGFTVTSGEDGVNVAYSRTVGAWSLIRSYVSGTFSDFDYVVMEITGTADKQVILKVEGSGVAKDIWFTLTGGRDIVILDISTLSDVQRDNIKMVLVFAEPGTDSTTGSFVIHSAEFTNTVPEVIVLENAFDGKGNEINTNLYWQKNTPVDPFTVTYDMTKAIVVADKAAGTQWSTIKLPVNGDFSVFSSIQITVLGPAGAQILFKINPSFEQWVTTTGVEQVITWDISGVTPALLENLEYVYAFPGAHTNEVYVGTFEISAFKWMRPVLTHLTEANPADLSVVDYLADVYLEGYTLTGNVDGSLTVDYSRTGGEWTSVRAYVNGAMSDYDFLVLKLIGTAPKQVLLKVEGTGWNKEYWVNLSGVSQYAVIDLRTLTPEQLDTMNMVLLFAEGGVAGWPGRFRHRRSPATHTHQYTHNR